MANKRMFCLDVVDTDLFLEVFEVEATKEARAKREKVLKETAGRYGLKW